MKAPFVVHFSVGEGEQGEEVAEEADSEYNGQVEGEEGGTFRSGVLGIQKIIFFLWLFDTGNPLT